MMIPIEAVEKYVEVKVVNKFALKEATREGWRLIAALAEETPNYEDVNGHSYTWNGHGTTPPIFKRLLFLVGRDLDATVADLAAERDRAQDYAKRMEDQAEERKKELVKAEKELKQALDAGEILMRAVETKDIEVKLLTEALRKMEIDMAKVRNAVGELKWKEIVS
jgi:hypothetical protein